MLNKILRLLVTGISILLISGCGMKGPLDRPDQAQAGQQTISHSPSTVKHI